MGELFYMLHDAQVLTGRWRCQYKMQHPHSALEYRPPAPEAHRRTDELPLGVTELKW